MRGGESGRISSRLIIARLPLVISYQQLVDRFPFLGDGADRAEDAQPLDMEAVV